MLKQPALAAPINSSGLVPGSCSKRDPKEDLGFVVNGIDMSTIGARFEGLYLPPPSRPDKPLSVKTLIVPTSEYADGRHVILPRYTQPEKELQVLLDQLKLSLPEQPPPRITAAGKLIE